MPSYGAYLDGIRDVLLRDGCVQLCRAVGRKQGKEISPDGIREIRIYAEKHGSDYHPARIEVVANEWVTPFVMNVAVTVRGRQRLDREFDVLRMLNRQPGPGFLPVAYLQAETRLSLRPGRSSKEDHCPAAMFLADWFDGFHEFHLSIDEGAGRQRLLVWDADRGATFLSDAQTWATYAGIARILTGYYDLKTFRQIFPWHHAAGDFVVQVGDPSLGVKLITARQYAPMVEEMGVFDALLFFLLNLSLRTRLDRLDGVGDIVWAGDTSVAATLAGFCDGVRLDGEALGRFLAYVGGIDGEELLNRFEALVDASDPNAPDIPILRRNLKEHAEVFRREVDRCRSPRTGADGTP